METPVLKGPMKSLVTWLESSGVDYELHEHDRSLTAMATARAEGVDPHTFEKVVWVRSADGGDALIGGYGPGCNIHHTPILTWPRHKQEMVG